MILHNKVVFTSSYVWFLGLGIPILFSHPFGLSLRQVKGIGTGET